MKQQIARKHVLNHLCNAFFFLVFLSILFFATSAIFSPKDNTKQSGTIYPEAEGFLSEPPNTIDLFVIGNSDAYCGFSPMELWNRKGYSSYVTGIPRQRMAEAVQTLQQVLTCQTPKIIVLNVDSIYTGNNQFKHVMKYMFSSVLPVFEFHNRWKTIYPNDFFTLPNYTYHSVSKGQQTSDGVKGYLKEEYMIPTDRRADIPRMARYSLDQFREICSRHEIPLVLMEMPSADSWSYERHNSIRDYADEYQLRFLDLNLEREKMNFDWKTDTPDGGDHLNTQGAQKVTVYLGDYIETQFSLTDHRADDSYRSWNEDYLRYSSVT